ncbi:MAG: LytTR family DNA-binding domain-containing protein [Firmicutes bacterium]|nr:LytTR family DNA-binding domain-containing protein [Bacillota bacterium]
MKGRIIMINILICDDNGAHLEYIRQLTLASVDNARIFPFGSGDDLLDYFEKNLHRADIIICDIELDSVNGIDLSKIIKSLNSNVQIIFVSAYIEYFEDVYSIDHISFLAKPIDTHKFRRAIQKAVKKSIESREKYITLTNKNDVYAINLNDIDYIEAALRQIKIYTKDIVYTKYSKIDEFVKLLDDRFLICHKSFAVNMDKIVTLSKNRFILESKAEVPISKSRSDYSKARFIDYLGGAYE